jgi:hypothetical protein
VSAAPADVTGDGLSVSSDQAAGDQAAGAQTTGAQGPSQSAAGPPAAQQPGDLGWSTDTGVDSSADTDEATFVAAAMSPAASVPLRSGPLVNGGAMAGPIGNGLSALGLNSDDPQLTADDVAAIRIMAAHALARLTAGFDVTMDGTRTGDDGEIREARAREEPPLSLRCADLLTEFLPFNRAALEDAIDSFLDPLEALGSEWASWSPSSSLFPTAAIIVTTALAAEVVRRRARSGRRTAEEGDEDLARFPGYASAWGLGET